MKEISEECLAVHHNTLRAARGDGRRVGGSKIPCVCDHALELKADWDEKNKVRKQADRESAKENPAMTRSEIQRAAKLKRYPLINVGYGPWRTLPECPVRQHNTLRAARGHTINRDENGNTRYVRERCICPQALSLLAQYHAMQTVKRTARRRGHTTEDGRRSDLRKPMTGQIRGPARRTGVSAVLADMPDLSGAACVTDPDAVRIFDEAVSSMDDEGRKIDAAKRICARCPLEKKRACADWVMKGEERPGEWLGVYGGMSPKDRIRLTFSFEGFARESHSSAGVA